MALSARSLHRAFWEGCFAGLIFFSLLLRWLAAAIIDFSALSPIWALAAVVSSAASFAPGWGIVAWGGARLARRWGPTVGLLALATLWCGYGLVRVFIPFPFPWGVLSAALAFNDESLGVARLLGAFGLSWLTALCAASLVGIWRASPRVFVTLFTTCWLLIAFSGVVMPAGATKRTARVAVVQGALSRATSDAARLDTYIELTRQAAKEGAHLIVWPESAVRYRIDGHPRYRMRLENLAAGLRADLLLESITTAPLGGVYNSAVLVRASGGVTTVAPKQHLVPFGEYLPGRWFLRDLPALAASSGDFKWGKRLRLHPSRVGKIGSLVCYEAVFADQVRTLARAGAELLANPTNDSWFGWTCGPKQHLAHGLLRSAETGLPLLRAANTGISAIVGGDGRLLQSLGLGRRGLLVADLALDRKPPPGLRIGGALATACAILALALFVAACLPQGASSRGGDGATASLKARRQEIGRTMKEELIGRWQELEKRMDALRGYL